MRVLIVDDDGAVRTVLGRILEKFFAVEVVEARNGLEALTYLAEQPFGVVFLDISMPAMSGSEVLSAIRRSPRHARLPVIAITAHASEQNVREMLKLGVTDYLVKPVRPSRVVERLEQVLAGLDGGNDLLEFPRTQLLDLTPETRVMLVDGDEEYRAFFTHHMSARCQVIAVGDGLRALELCLSERPYAVFIGPEIGLLRGDLLAHKLRRTPNLGTVRIIGLVPPALVKRHEKRSPFHAVLPHTFVGSLLDQSLETLLHQPNRMIGVLDVVPQLKLAMIAAVEQACTATFNTELQFRADASPLGSKGKATVASVRIEASDGLPPLRLEIGCTQKGLKQLRGKQMDAGAPEAALCAVAEFVADRVVQAMGERQFVAIAHPASAKSLVGVVADEADSLALPFCSTIGSVTLLLTLKAERHAAAA